MTESEVLEGCRSGDPAAAAELMRRHQGPVARIVFQLVGRRSVTEEIVQEAFLRTFDEIARIDPAQGARRWVLRIAVNLARTHAVRSRRTQLTAKVPERGPILHAAPDESPEERLLRTERFARYRDALERLSPKLREVVVLHYVEEIPFAELSKILRTPVPALKMRALRARAQLMALIGEDA